MKKTYEKPQIVFDNFELSQSIAAGCSFISNHAWKICGVYNEDFGEWIFNEVSGASACTITPAEIDDRICYHVSPDENMVFSS